jgi:5-methylcytosine-specific restriction endonuclease McrA
VLAEEPTCRIFGAPATDVDHIIAVADGGGMYDRANLRPLCRKHHKKHTAAQNRARRQKTRQKEV